MRGSPATRGALALRPLLSALVFSGLSAYVTPSTPSPLGPQVTAGQVHFEQQGPVLTVTNSANAVIDWQQFNIAAGHTVQFVQSDMQSAVLNRVTGSATSLIEGTLQSNGTVYLINPNGIVFSPTAVVNVHALVASTLSISSADFLEGRLRFEGERPGDVVNRGTLSAGVGGRVLLMGGNVSNEGLIVSPAGHLALAAGQRVELADLAGPQLRVTLQGDQGRVINLGRLQADTGRIDLFGGLIEQQGIVRADAVGQDAAGRIVLQATRELRHAGQTTALGLNERPGAIQMSAPVITLGESSEVDVSGQGGAGQIDVSAGHRGEDKAAAADRLLDLHTGAQVRADGLIRGDGGRIQLFSSGALRQNATVTARGGALSGNGGFVETSAARLQLGGSVNTVAPSGRAGTWLIDPRRICVYAVNLSECSSGRTVFNHAETFDTRIDSAASGAEQFEDSLISVGFLESRRQNSSIVLHGSELIAVLPDGGQWLLGSSGSGSIRMTAPVMYLGGVIAQPALAGAHTDAVDTAGILNLDWVATGAGELIAGVGQAGSILLGEQAGIIGGLHGSRVSLSANRLDFAQDSAILLSRSELGQQHLLRSRLELTPGPLMLSGTGPELPGTWFEASPGTSPVLRVHNQGLTAQADEVSIRRDHRSQFTGQPLLLNAGRVRVDFDFATQGIRTWSIADTECQSSLTQACSPFDFLSFLGGTIGRADVLAFGAPGGSDSMVSGAGVDVILGGALQTVSPVTSLLATGDLVIAGEMNPAIVQSEPQLAAFLQLRADRDLLVNAAIANPSGSLSLQAGNALLVDAPVLAAQLLELVRQESLLSGVTSSNSAGIHINSQLTGEAVILSVNPPTHGVQASESLALTRQPTPAQLYLLADAVVLSPGVSGVVKVRDADINGFAEVVELNSGILIELGTNSTLNNQAGPNVLMSQGLSKEWLIARAPVAVNDIGASFYEPGGLSVGALDFDLAISRLCATGSDCLSKAGSRFAGYSFEVLTDAGVTGATGATGETGSVQVSITGEQAASDPCLISPTLCSPAGSTALSGPVSESASSGLSVAPAGLVGNAGTYSVSSPNGPLRIDAVLTERSTAASTTINPQAAAGAETPGDQASSSVDVLAAVQSHNPSTQPAGDLLSRQSEQLRQQAASVLSPGAAALLLQRARVLQLQAQLTHGADNGNAAPLESASVQQSLNDERQQLQQLEAQRPQQRREESRTAFGPLSANRAVGLQPSDVLALRRELKTETLGAAVAQLDENPEVADLPPCDGKVQVCIPGAVSVKATSDEPVKPTIAYLPAIQRKFALMIGINAYADPDIPSLDTALPDSMAVGRLLQAQFGYTVKVLPDAKRADIVKALNELAMQAGPQDSVAVYFAGHGYQHEKSGHAFWIPADATAASPANWLSNRDITRLLGNIPARQLLLVSDSCYSGSLTGEMLTPSLVRVNTEQVLARRSVTVMSSGGEEPVSDEGLNGHSIFAFHFMEALKDVSTVDAAGLVFRAVRQAVTPQASQQPQYGGIISANHQAGGEFLFEVRSYE